jgi:AcrR family transcriptional regulator
LKLLDFVSLGRALQPSRKSTTRWNYSTRRLRFGHIASRFPSTTTRRRPLRKGDRAEQAILDTAERLLRDRPLASIGIDELAAGAGISRPSFYFYFQSREAVLRTLAERITDELYRSSGAWLRRSDESPEDAIRRTVEANLAVWRQHGSILRATLQARDSDPELRRLWDSVARRFLKATATQIEHERAAGLAPPGPPDTAALAAVLVGMNVQAFHEASRRRRPAAPDQELVDTLTTVWLRAVYGAAPAGGRQRSQESAGAVPIARTS